MTSDWNHLIDAAVALRRDLHREPEPKWEERRTARRVRAELDRVGARWDACADTGTVARFAPAAKGRHIALRADLDALPLVEETGLPWASQIDGCMHACGHDGHTATAIATAWWLARWENELPGPVTLLFQPAEEGGHGAREMIRGGALEDVAAIFGWHNWPAIPFGRAVCPDGVVMSANGTFEIELRGRGGHASQPEACRDPVLAAAAVTMALQQIVARRIAPQEAAVLSVSSIEAPSFPTITPERALVGGSFRLADDGLRPRFHEWIEEIATQTARAYGVEAQISLHPRYGATVNHPEEAVRYRGALAEELGESWRDDAAPVPIMASEDFSYYLRERPGAFALVGAGDGRGHDAPCHSTSYDFNDDLIERMARVYARLAGAPLPDRSTRA